MLQDRYILADKLDKWFDSHGGDTAYVQGLADILYEKYNLPMDFMMDIVAGRKPIAACNDLVCFWLTMETRPELIPEFFTKAEIKNYTTVKYEVEEPVLPLELQALPLSSDQWLTTMTIRQIMQLRKNSMIHYNAETQRALKMLVRGEEVSYVPYTNKKAVREMRGLMTENMFIANVLTFNINADEDAEFSYKNGILRIDKLSAFDIVDGYNRFKAYESTYDDNPDYQFTTGVMVTNFPVSKAKQFIYQENHHTPMRRIDSDALSQVNNYNTIIERINLDSKCNLKGEINSGTGHIRFGMAARAITIGINKKDLAQRDVVTYTPKLIEQLNRVTEARIELLDRKWEDYEITVIFFTICWCNNTDQILKILDTFAADESAQYDLTMAMRGKRARSQIIRLFKKYANIDVDVEAGLGGKL